MRPILGDLSSALRHLGPTGRAAQVKALVNMVMNINTAGLAEGLGLGAALGLDLDLLREVFAQTGANSQVLKTDGEDMQNRAHDCFFSGAHAAKDSTIAWTLGTQSGLNLPLAAGTDDDRYLEVLGLPRSALLLTVVLDDRQEGHAVLMLATSEGDFILDNRRDGVRRWTDSDYTFLKRQSPRDPRDWQALAPAPEDKAGEVAARAVR